MKSKDPNDLILMFCPSIHQPPEVAGQTLTRVCSWLRSNPHWLHIQLPSVGPFQLNWLASPASVPPLGVRYETQKLTAVQGFLLVSQVY